MELEKLKYIDPELYDCINSEKNRQDDTLEMIASESIQSDITLAIEGCVFNNKTAVGNIGNQRLMGSRYADQLEKLTTQRACEVFGAEHANITAYSGSVANYCGYFACLDIGDRVLSLDPDVGSHQTHGGKNNISSEIYKFDYFGLNHESLLIDYNEAEKKAREFSPKLIVVGSASYPRNIDYERLAQIAHKNGALLMTDIAHFSGLIAAGVTPSPVPYADVITASGTKTMCGPHTGFIMCKKQYAEAVDRSVWPGNIASLHLQTIAALAYALQNTKTVEFREMMHKVVDNAQYLCERLKEKGFGIVTGGTDCHMFIADLRPFSINGKRFADMLEKIGITVNTKNIPYDNVGGINGVRAGTTVLTQRGFGEKQLDEISEIFYAAAVTRNDELTTGELKEKVRELSEKYRIKR